MSLLKLIAIGSERLCFISCLFLSKATHLTASNLVTLMKCTLASNRTYPTEVWKLLFQKASPELDKALETFATMVNATLSQNWCFPVPILSNQNYFPNSRHQATANHPRHMHLRLSERWELPTSARHNCRVMTLSAAGSRQIFVRFWPPQPPTSYSASAPRTSAARPTRLCKQTCDTLLYCEHWWQMNLPISSWLDVYSLLSIFSIKAFSSQMASMDREQQQAVYTHFIRPFLSRNDSSGKRRHSGSIRSSFDGMWLVYPANVIVSVFFADPGCVSFNRGSKEWLQGNFGNFSGFAKLRDLQHLNANFSSVSGG